MSCIVCAGFSACSVRETAGAAGWPIEAASWPSGASPITSRRSKTWRRGLLVEERSGESRPPLTAPTLSSW
eukprot:1584770-Pyramimonas_sp.AAC.1